MGSVDGQEFNTASEDGVGGCSWQRDKAEPSQLLQGSVPVQAESISTHQGATMPIPSTAA